MYISSIHLANVQNRRRRDILSAAQKNFGRNIPVVGPTTARGHVRSISNYGDKKHIIINKGGLEA